MNWNDSDIPLINFSYLNSGFKEQPNLYPVEQLRFENCSLQISLPIIRNGSGKRPFNFANISSVLCDGIIHYLAVRSVLIILKTTVLELLRFKSEALSQKITDLYFFYKQISVLPQ